jgi:hypothetical protein
VGACRLGVFGRHHIVDQSAVTLPHPGSTLGDS